MQAIKHEIAGGGFAGADISGGKMITFPFVRGEQRVRMTIGNGVMLAARDRISNWRTFLNVFWSKKFDVKYTPALVKVVSEVTGLDTKGFSIDDLVQALHAIAQLPADVLLKAQYKLLGHHLHIGLGVRPVFMSWKQHLERMIVRFNEARTQYIKKHKLADSVNDIQALIKSWKAVDTKHGVRTSSKLLLYSLPPPNLGAMKWVKALRWSPKPAPFHWRVGDVKEVEAFIAAAEKFVYLGYCPREPVTRTKALMQFPIKELLAAIQALGGSLEVDYCTVTIPKPFPAFKVKAKASMQVQFSGTPAQQVRQGVDAFIAALKKNADTLEDMEVQHVLRMTSLANVGHVTSRFTSTKEAY
jgi:hypothetical protein